MKNVKLLLAFAAGVGITLLLTGRVPGFRGDEWPHWSFQDGIEGTLAVIILVIVAAFLTAKFSSQSNDPTAPQNRIGGFFDFLKNLKKSSADLWLGGVCGGLGTVTRVPAWVWRLGFAVAVTYYGTGLLAYLLLWIFLPEGNGVRQSDPATHKPTTFLEFLRHLKRSTKDVCIGGVCGGLAEQTAAPAWVWRLGFTALVLCYGTGVLAYVLLWVFVPADEAKQQFPA